jgi:hypothetical protein
MLDVEKVPLQAFFQCSQQVCLAKVFATMRLSRSGLLRNLEKRIIRERGIGGEDDGAVCFSDGAA